MNSMKKNSNAKGKHSESKHSENKQAKRKKRKFYHLASGGGEQCIKRPFGQ